MQDYVYCMFRQVNGTLYLPGWKGLSHLAVQDHRALLGQAVTGERAECPW